MQFFAKLFPHSHKRNIALFYVLTAATNLWFVAGVWLFIWGKFMTNQEIGISDAMTFAFGLLLELPSGVIADLMGRKRAVVFGHICMVLGNLAIAYSSSFWGITLWYGFWTLGYAFQSGTTEAIAYDSLTPEEQEKDWPKIIARSVIVRRVTSLVCTSFGGLLFAIHFRLPYAVTAVIGLLGIWAATRLISAPVTHKHNLRELSTYTSQIKDGLKVLSQRAVWPIAMTGLVVTGIDYMFNWGLLRPLTAIRFGYTEITVSIIQAIISVVVIAMMLALPKLRTKLGTVRLLLIAASLYGSVFASFYLPYEWVLGGLALIIAAVAATYVEQTLSVFVNRFAKAEHRATTLSAMSLFTKAPYVILAVLIGGLADGHQLAPFTLIVGLFTLLVGAVGILAYRRTPSVKAADNLVQ